MTALAQHCAVVIALVALKNSRHKACEACGRKVSTNDRHKNCQRCRKAGGYRRREG